MKVLYFSFLLIILHLCENMAFAQNDKVHFGLRGGLNVSVEMQPLSAGETFDITVNPNIGLVGLYDLSEHLQVQAELYLSPKGVHFQSETDIPHIAPNDSIKTEILKNDYKIATYYMDLPVTLVYKWKDFRLFAGAQYSNLLSANRVGTSTNVITFKDLQRVPQTVQVSISDKVTKNYNKIDYGLVGGLAYMVKQKYMVELRGYYGLADITTNSRKVQNGMVSVGLKYFFR